MSGARYDRDDRLAVGCWLAWTAGATLSRAFGIWAGVGGVAVVLAVVVLLRAGATLRQLLAPTPALLLWGGGAAAVMIAATRLLYALDRAGLRWTSSGTTQLYDLTRAGAPGWTIGVLLPLVVVAEELVWRGVVQRALGERFRALPAVLLSAIAYAAAHAPIGSPLLVGVAFVCGVTWSGLRSRTGSLVPSLVCHLAWDLAIVVVWPLG